MKYLLWAEGFGKGVNRDWDSNDHFSIDNCNHDGEEEDELNNDNKVG